MSTCSGLQLHLRVCLTHQPGSHRQESLCFLRLSFRNTYPRTQHVMGFRSDLLYFVCTLLTLEVIFTAKLRMYHPGEIRTHRQQAAEGHQLKFRSDRLCSPFSLLPLSLPLPFILIHFLFKDTSVSYFPLLAAPRTTSILFFAAAGMKIKSRLYIDMRSALLGTANEGFGGSGFSPRLHKRKENERARESPSCARVRGGGATNPVCCRVDCTDPTGFENS